MFQLSCYFQLLIVSPIGTAMLNTPTLKIEFFLFITYDNFNSLTLVEMPPIYGDKYTMRNPQIHFTIFRFPRKGNKQVTEAN